LEDFKGEYAFDMDNILDWSDLPVGTIINHMIEHLSSVMKLTVGGEQ